MAFDCLSHNLILHKLKAFGLIKFKNLLESYLSDRKQRIKLGIHTSNWLNIIKGVSHGSILGPLILNIFMNDIFYFVKKGTLYIYADDNNVSYWDKILHDVVQGLSAMTLILI